MEPSASDFTQVVFHDIAEVFSFHSPLKCRYTVEAVLAPNSKDWIGLFKLGWRTVKEYVYFEWSPLPDNLETGREVDNFVIFKAETLPKDTSEFYQFLYVASTGKVCGASPPFQFRNPTCSEFVEVDETPSMLLVHPKVTSLSGSDTLMENLTFSSLPGQHGSLSSEGLVFSNSEEVERLKKQLADAEDEVSVLKSQVHELELKLQQLPPITAPVSIPSTSQNDPKLSAALAEVDTLKDQLAAQEFARKRLEEQLHDRTAHEDSLSTELSKREKEILTLTQKLTVADVDVATRSQTLDSLKRVIDQYAEENDYLKKMIETYTVRQLELVAEVDHGKKEIVDLKAAAEFTAFTSRNIGHTAAASAAANIPGHVSATATHPAGVGDGAFTEDQNIGRRSAADGGATGGAASAAAASGSSPDGEHFTCPYCPETFPSSIGETFVMDHISSHEDKVCPVCESKFPSSTSMEIFETHVDECLARGN